jgi:periplasmic divalent cation tolerance protein
MEEYLQIFTTTEKKQDAERIASSLVDKRLAGCVQITGPIISNYHWKGAIETSEEWLCIIKSRRDLYEEIEKAIKEIHPYETPEIIATPIVAGSRDYLTWLSDELKKE